MLLSASWCLVRHYAESVGRELVFKLCEGRKGGERNVYYESIKWYINQL